MNRFRLVIIVVGILGIVATHSTIRVAHGASYNAIDGSQVKDFTLQKIGNVWHVISIHVPETPTSGQGSAGLAHATSRDLSHWTEQGIAIPTGEIGAWDDYDIWAPSVVQKDGTYYLFYAGVHMNGSQPQQRIGLATSTDMTTWVKQGAEPVFDCAALSWTYTNPTDIWGVGMECRDPYVTWDTEHERWIMFYTARMTHLNQPPLTNVEFPAVVGTAYSTDLLHWSDSGYILSTAGNKAESPHVFEKNGTWYLVWTNDCSFDGSTKCLQYATAASIVGPYGVHQDIPELYWANFASEFYRDGSTDYFGYDVANALEFRRIDWTTGAPSFIPTPAGTVYGAVFLDANTNGVLDDGETEVNGVSIEYWYDDGDGQFDAQSDEKFYTFPTLRTKRPDVFKNGTYRLTSAWPGTLWTRIADTNFRSGGKLEGLVSTSGEVIERYTIEDAAVVAGRNFGFAPPDTTAPAAVGNLSVE